MQEDAFFAASLTTAQEAQADRLAVLYATLAGYDAEAGARIWDRTGQTEAMQGYLNTHPVGADRAARVRLHAK
jgi:predicted Zn-dependent protease